MREKLPFLTKFFYGFGSLAYGIKDNAFNYFLVTQAWALEGKLRCGLVVLTPLLCSQSYDSYSSSERHTQILSQ